MTANPLLQVRQLSRSYRDGDAALGGAEVTVLQQLDLTVAGGDSVAVVGVSGSGKSTLLNLLAGLDDPSGGAITLAGRSWAQQNSSERAQWRNRHIGMVYQFHHLLPEFSAVENIELPLLIAGVAAAPARQRANELLQQVGLSARASHRPMALSGGERQRVAICRALANQPSLVLMDEPTGNLDPATAGELEQLLLELNQHSGTAFIIVTHDHRLAARMGRQLELVDGQLQPWQPRS
ncbi:ABC transporter ATP-binding protein [Gammaproteobacteria bacterium LSUCC0057]|uniref:ABC transporter ATP-binding protein n=1 Tax=Gammaproteobacteria bacterium LSUCC0057 TaxID=2559237 RepID=A0A4Y8UNF0_9GAMM|nr:ABC transporter ATP-binding protein [Gammaproteobacteria bacterium LSUCC0057]